MPVAAKEGVATGPTGHAPGGGIAPKMWLAFVIRGAAQRHDDS
jgi:hypothetical protein